MHNHALEVALLLNGIFGVATHAWLIINWFKNTTVRAEKKAEILIHARSHGGVIEGCVECQELTRAYRHWSRQKH